MTYVWNGTREEPVRTAAPTGLWRKPRVPSFGDDEEARRAAKRETDAAYRARHRERILARQREWYAKNKASQNH